MLLHPFSGYVPNYMDFEFLEEEQHTLVCPRRTDDGASSGAIGAGCVKCVSRAIVQKKNLQKKINWKGLQAKTMDGRGRRGSNLSTGAGEALPLRTSQRRRLQRYAAWSYSGISRNARGKK